MLIITIVGARPQFVKSSVVSRALAALPGVEERIIHTGQHYDANMSDVFFSELDIPHPAYHLGIGGGTHGAQTGQMLEAIERVLLAAEPDWVLVYGDTNSTLAGALAAAKLHIPVAHVEAGLRSFNRRMPEEINRVLTDHLSTILFAPTDVAMDNLRHEGIAEARLHQVGDVMYDAALYFEEKATRTTTMLADLGLQPGGYLLTTLHRAENTDDPVRLRALAHGLMRLARQHRLVLPLHPRTRGALSREGLLDKVTAHLRVIDPVGYLDMLALEKHARLIITDSGGVQKEAFFYRVPCVTMRDESEWAETVESGANLLVGADPERLLGAVEKQLRRSASMPDPARFYGNGDTAQRIARLLAVGADESALVHALVP